jgi:hypothetical protein
MYTESTRDHYPLRSFSIYFYSIFQTNHGKDTPSSFNAFIYSTALILAHYVLVAMSELFNNKEFLEQGFVEPCSICVVKMCMGQFMIVTF